MTSPSNKPTRKAVDRPNLLLRMIAMISSPPQEPFPLRIRPPPVPSSTPAITDPRSRSDFRIDMNVKREKISRKTGKTSAENSVLEANFFPTIK